MITGELNYWHGNSKGITHNNLSNVWGGGELNSHMDVPYTEFHHIYYRCQNIHTEVHS